MADYGQLRSKISGMLTDEMRSNILLRYVCHSAEAINNSSNCAFWAKLEALGKFSMNNVNISVFDGYLGIEELIRCYHGTSIPEKIIHEDSVSVHRHPLSALASAINEDQHGEELLTVGAWFKSNDIHVRTILPLMDTYGLWKNLLTLYKLNRGDAMATLVLDLSNKWEVSGHKTQPTLEILSILISEKKGFSQTSLFDFCDDLIKLGNSNLVQLAENLKKNIQERQKTALAEGQANFNAQTGLREWLLGGICKPDRVDVLVAVLQKEYYSEVKHLKKFTEDRFERYGFKGREAESAFERIQDMIKNKEI